MATQSMTVEQIELGDRSIWAGWVWPVIIETVRDSETLHSSTPFQQFAFGEQVHGTQVFVVGRTDLDVSSSDGLVTKEAQIGLTVRTADCLPILAYDPVARIVGVAHAGWRGLAAGIVGSLLDKLKEEGAETTNVRFVFGPHGAVCCYHIDTQHPGVQPAFGDRGVFETRGGVTYLDLAATAVQELKSRGIADSQIVIDSRCTIHHSDLPSHRRQQADRLHSLVGVIGMVDAQ